MNQSNRKKGDFLEVMALQIEKQLASSPNTIISRQHKLIDRDGFDREIDIYCEVEVNKKVLRYAIECKHYGKNSIVKLSDIDSFYSKIANQGLKGIFLTTGRFQRNAVKKAKKLNIDLYTVTESGVPLIEKIILRGKRYEIKNVAFWSNELPESSMQSVDTIFFQDDSQFFSHELFYRYTELMLEDMVQPNFHEMFNSLYNDNWELEDRKEFRIEGKFLPGFYVKLNSQKYPITDFRGYLDFWLEEFNFDYPKTMDYKSLSGEVVFAKFLCEEIELQNSVKAYFNMILVEDEALPVFRIISKDGQLLHDFYPDLDGDFDSTPL